MKRLGVILKPYNDFIHTLNPGACIDANNHWVHLFPRLVKKNFASSVGWLKLDLENRKISNPAVLFESNKPYSGWEDPRAVNLKHNGTSEIVMTMTHANYVGLPTGPVKFRGEWQTKAALTRATSMHDFSAPSFFTHANNGEVRRNTALFPEKINGWYYILHRIFPDILIARSKDLINWQDSEVVLGCGQCTTFKKIGAGAPPIKTEKGWLEIYHEATGERPVRVYTMKAALFDLKDPYRLLAITKSPLMFPEESYEKNGWVKNVVFPSGAIKLNNTIRVYYGAADHCIAAAEFSEKEIFGQLSSIK